MAGLFLVVLRPLFRRKSMWALLVPTAVGLWLVIGGANDLDDETVRCGTDEIEPGGSCTFESGSREGETISFEELQEEQAGHTGEVVVIVIGSVILAATVVAFVIALRRRGEPEPAVVTGAGPATVPAVAAPAAPPPPAWHPDPLGRFEQRYWDGTRWTEHVSTGGTQAADPV